MGVGQATYSLQSFKHFLNFVKNVDFPWFSVSQWDLELFPFLFCFTLQTNLDQNFTFCINLIIGESGFFKLRQIKYVTYLYDRYPTINMQPDIYVINMFWILTSTQTNRIRSNSLVFEFDLKLFWTKSNLN
jgi:hypothetical protein